MKKKVFSAVLCSLTILMAVSCNNETKVQTAPNLPIEVYPDDSVCKMNRYSAGFYSIMVPEIMRPCERDEMMGIFDYGFQPIDDSHYARILFQEIYDDYSEISNKINNGRHLSQDDEGLVKEYYIEGMKGSDTPIIEWYGVDYVKIGDYYSCKISYLRKGFPTPTHVDQYSIYTKTKQTVITTSYRTDETNLWRTNLMKSINSLSNN